MGVEPATWRPAYMKFIFGETLRLHVTPVLQSFEAHFAPYRLVFSFDGPDEPFRS